jgi:hypothetical protein
VAEVPRKEFGVLLILLRESAIPGVVYKNGDGWWSEWLCE